MGFLFLLALCWFLFGSLVVTGVVAITQSVPLRLVMGVIAIDCSFVIGLSTYCLFRGIKAAYWFTSVLMGLILIVSFMDDLGWVDFTLIGITALTLGLLLKDRRWYLEKDKNTGASVEGK